MSRSSMNRKGGAGSSGGSRIVVMIVVLVLLVGVGTGIIFLMNSDLGKAGPGDSSSPAPTSPIMPESDKFYNGVFVDDIPLGGLTHEEAKQKIEARQQEYVTKTGVTIAKDDKTWQIMISETAFSFDTDAVLDEAYKQGRIGTSEERKEAVDKLPDNPVKLTTTVTIDPSGLEQKVRELAAPYAVPAMDASYKEYDMTNHTLVFNPDVPGSRVDDDVLWAAVQKEFAERTFGTVQMQVVPVEATVKVSDLQTNLQLVTGPDITGFDSAENKRINAANKDHTYTTHIRNSAKGRLKNIELGNKAVSGTLLMPGDTLSVNKKTGERTAAKGYQKAPVDANGIEDVGLAGGMCQVSGTLFNAAIAAGPNRVEIIEREHHSLPSAYMAKGTDATVDYPNKDMQFKNITDKPMLIVMYYEKAADGKYYEHADIYTIPEPEGAMYKLEGSVVQTLPGNADAAPKMVPNNALNPGETKLIPAHSGYVVARYWVKIAKDGTISKTKLETDTYPASGPVLAYYAKDAKPTPTPEPTATPAATDAPVTDPATPAPTDPPPPTEAPTEAPPEAPAG